MTTTKCFLITLLITFSLYPQSLIQQIDTSKNSPGFQTSSWGIYAEFTDTGEEIINSDGHLSLAPASNLKLFTSSAALHFLGDDYRFITSIYINNRPDVNGILHGDLLIRGGGDPTLGSNQVNGSPSLDSLMEQWTTAVIKSGIKEIKGSIIADDLWFDRNPLPDYYPWIDIGNYYGAGTSGLTIHDNLYYLYFKPGENKGDPAEVINTYPEIPGLTFINEMKTGPKGSGDNGYIYFVPFQNYTLKLRGTIPAGVNEFPIKGTLPDPPLFTAGYFHKYLTDKGIKISGRPSVTDISPAYNSLELIHTNLSPPLKDIIYIINKKSNNLYTEQVLKMTGLKVFSHGSFHSGINAVEKYLSELNVSDEGLSLFDGSGLSRNNMITPVMMCKMLSAITRQSYFNAFYNSLGIAGDPDDISSFKNFGANSILAYNARIKSGTVNGVRSHSGYVKTKKGRLVSFSFIANNFTASSSRVNEIHVQILKRIAEEN